MIIARSPEGTHKGRSSKAAASFWRLLITFRYLSWFAGLFCLLLTVVLWLAIRHSDSRKMGMLSQLEAQSVSSEISRRFETRVLAMQRMVSHWERYGRPKMDEWAFDAHLFLEHKGYHCVGWIDRDYRLRWAVTAAGINKVKSLGRDMRYDDSHSREMLKEAYLQKGPVLSALSNLSDGSRGVRLAIPIFHKGHFEGFIVAAFRASNLLRTVLHSGLAPGYSISVWEDSEFIFGRGLLEHCAAPQLSRTSQMMLYGTRWTITVCPKQEQVDLVHSYMSSVVLFSGTLISLLISFAIRLAQMAGLHFRRTELMERRELALRERANSNRKFSAFMEAAPDAMVVLDSNYRIDACNSATERFFGFSLGEIQGKRVTILSSGDAETETGQELKAFLKGGTDVWLRRKDGSSFAADIEVSAISTEDGFYRIASIRDVTYRHESQAELEKKSQDLERSNRDLENFAYVASHDLQEPLRMITSYLFLLKRGYGSMLDEKGKEFIHYCTDASSRLNNMIKGLLLLSKVSNRGLSLRLEVVDTRNLVQEVTNDLSVMIRENGGTVISGVLPTIMAERDPLRQVFQNLIANAVKYRKADLSPVIEVSCRKKENEWEFCVSDNGIGFEMSHSERIFGIFQRLHSRDQYSGNGIGLALCRRIVENHGGKIWAQGEPDRGAHFYFTIPQQGFPLEKPQRGLKICEKNLPAGPARSFGTSTEVERVPRLDGSA